MPDDELARALLNLLPGFTPPRCHGYANGCTCAQCRRRQRIVELHAGAGRDPYTSDGELRPLPKRRESRSAQPWEARPAQYQGAADMLNINTPAGAPPRDLLDEALREVHGQVSIYASTGEQPPQLQPSITRARVAQEMDDVQDLVRELRNIAHAAIASIVRVRAAADHVPTP